VLFNSNVLAGWDAVSMALSCCLFMNPFLSNPQDYFILILWVLIPIGYLIGLWKEGFGGLISLVSALALIIIFITREGHRNLFYLYLILSILLIPSILYLMYWYFNRKITAEANSAAN
jgi:hypothetical protein